MLPIVSAGSAMAGLLQLKYHFHDDDPIVVIFHDHGSRYLGKMFNDDMAARDLVAAGLSGELFSLECNEPVAQAIRVMSEHDFSQVSVTYDKRLVGSLNGAHLYEDPDNLCVLCASVASYVFVC